MDATSLLIGLLIGLGVGLALGAAVCWAFLRERVRSAERWAERLGTDRAGTEAAAAHAVRESSGQLLAVAGERFDRDLSRREAADQGRDAALHRTLGPITESLSQLERSMARTEAARAQADGTIAAQVRELARRSQDLEQGTSALTAALRAPTSRGRWGEVQLRRIVETAGMVEHVDFSEQTTGRAASGDSAQRPDMVVHLSGDRHVVLDAKAPMDAYLDAMDARDEQTTRKGLRAHATALRGHVDRLGAKSYWSALGDSPEFVVLFVPSDGVLAAALEADPGLLDHAFTKDVVIASPATLVALLRTVAHTWRTQALQRDAREILDTGRELHHRLGTYLGHVQKLGRSLDGAVGSYNDALGSLRSRVLVSARKFEALSSAGTALPETDDLDRRPTTFSDQEIADLAVPDPAAQEERRKRA